MIKNINKNALSLLTAIAVCIVLVACGNKTSNTQNRTEDKEKKQLLQGVWTNELDGSIVFSVKGDTIFFADTLSTPATFHIYGDSIQIDYHPAICYKITRCSQTTFKFINTDGDEMSLTKSANFKSGKTPQHFQINQGCIIKKDSIINSKQTKYHAYTQVNPTTYKIYKQQTNADGMQVETTYFDNIVYIALYDGNKKIYGHNIEKKQFKKLVPESYISQAILSEIKITGLAPNGGVRYDAILMRPDSYTSYIVHIDITSSGKISFSL